ncbi:MAG: hypothetical protein M3380_11865, partial [Chloroflexota bacterium]|nr:hypothetical protein [Chloroflexota bacterium]
CVIRFLSGTHPGKWHEKSIVDDAQYSLPAGSVLYQDMGFQGLCHLKIGRQADRSGPVLRLPAPIYNATTDWIAANDRDPCLTTLT